MRCKYCNEVIMGDFHKESECAQNPKLKVIPWKNVWDAKRKWKLYIMQVMIILKAQFIIVKIVWE